MWRGLLAAVVATIALAPANASVASSHAVVVATVVDGDTLTLTNGARVRLVQIDAPEIAGNECYTQAARRALLRLAPIGAAVALEADPALDKVDRFGRLLRYVKRSGRNVNLELVRQGAAAPYFFDRDLGRYARELTAAATVAKARGRGLWGAHPHTQLDPFGPVDTGRCGRSAPVTLVPPTGCDPNYVGACVPSYPPDLDCADLRTLGLALPVRIVGDDPHRLDGDADGYGCE
jgi:micrococcal nuclease